MTNKLKLGTLISFALMGSAWAAPIVYAVSDSQQFGTFDLGTGAFSQIGSTPDLLYGIVYTSAGLQGLTADGRLVNINSSNGALTTVGNTGLGVSTNVITGLNNNLYTLATNGNLYTINASTGAPTLVGSTGLPTIDPNNDDWNASLTSINGSLYYTIQNLSTNFGPSLYRINPGTGAAQLVGSTQGDLNAAVFAGGVYYATSSASVFSINAGTGAATTLSPIGAGVTPLYGLASVPEPGSLVLMGAGLASLLVARRMSGMRSRRSS